MITLYNINTLNEQIQNFAQNYSSYSGKYKNLYLKCSQVNRKVRNILYVFQLCQIIQFNS